MKRLSNHEWNHLFISKLSMSTLMFQTLPLALKKKNGSLSEIKDCSVWEQYYQNIFCTRQTRFYLSSGHHSYFKAKNYLTSYKRIYQNDKEDSTGSQNHCFLYYHWVYFEFSDLWNIGDPEHGFKNASSHHKYQRVWSRVFMFAKIKTKHINRLHVETVFVISAYDNSDNYFFFF
jgi:hypothetical protein